MSGGPPDDEVRRLLDDLAAMRLPASEWADIEDALRGIDPGTPGSGERISQVVFEARVHRRFHGGRAASTLPPTKRTSSLPWVGLVCGALLLAVGGALGGGPVLVGVALLGLFVFGIAMAGSRVTHARVGERSAEATEPVVPMPPSTAAVVATHRP
jgi:hypothetical protein